MLLPVGALPPQARDYTGARPDQTEFSIRYGGWRYDINDGVHNNYGATLTRRIGGSSTTVSLTGAYLSLSCDCSVWASAGLSARSILWSGAQKNASGSGVSWHVAISGMVGGARFAGEGHAKALAAQSALDLGVGVPVLHGSRVNLSVFPGIGVGRLDSDDDDTHGGVRQTLGAALSWAFPRGFSIDLGTQRVILVGGPEQYGLGISWRRR